MFTNFTSSFIFFSLPQHMPCLLAQWRWFHFSSENLRVWSCPKYANNTLFPRKLHLPQFLLQNKTKHRFGVVKSMVTQLPAGCFLLLFGTRVDSNGNRINSPGKNPPRKNPPKKIPLNAVECEPVLTRVLNPNASEASYKLKQRSYRKMKLIFFFIIFFFRGDFVGGIISGNR